MAAEFAVITQVTGQAWIRTDDGSLVAVSEGQRIPLDTVIITGDGGSVQLSIDGMLPIVVGANREFVFSADVVQVDVDSDEAALVDDPAVDTLASLLDAGRDPFDLLESTAAVRDSDRAFYIHRSNLGDAGSAEHVNSLVRLLALTHATLPLNEQTTGSTPPLVGTLADLFTRGLQGQSDSGLADLGSFGNGASPLFSNSQSFGGNNPLLGGNSSFAPAEPASARISINTIAGDGIVNATEARGNILISGDVGGDAKAGDIVRVTVGGTDYITQVQGGGVWSVNVPGSLLAGHASVSAQVVTANASNASAVGTAQQAYVVDLEASATITLNSIAGNNILDAAESRGSVVVSGSVGGDAKVGDTVTVIVGNQTFTTTVHANDGGALVWSVNVSGSLLAANTSVSVSVLASDAAGNITTPSFTQPYLLDLAPVAQGGEAQGVEDTPLVLGWANFHVAGSSAELGVLITGLPAAGVLEYSSNPGAADAVWVRVDLADGGFSVSRAELEAGQLRFVPQANESGWNGLDGNGVGNGQADYAQISFRPVDGDYVGETAVLKVDIVAVVDAPVVTLSLGEVISGGGAEAGAGTQFTFAGITLTVLNDGSVSASGLPGQVFAPPFGKETSGNVNYGDQSPATDIIAVIGNFDKVVLGRDGRPWDNLQSISGQGDYVFFNKASGEYSVNWMTVNVNNGIPSISASIKDNASGLSINLNNIRGILFGDGHSVGGKDSAPIAGLETQAVGGYVDVEVNVTAMLTDRDGSESLSGITLSGIPAGVTVEGATLLSNGNWFVSNASGLLTLDGHLVMRVPNGTEPFSITASAASTEQGLAGSDSTSSASLQIGSDTLDVVAEASITINPITNDNVVNAAESLGNVTISGTVGGDAKAGDTVTITIGDQTYTATVQPPTAVGLPSTWSVSVAGSLLAAGTSVSASVLASDEVGNTVTPSATQEYTVDTVAPELTVSVKSITSDNVINIAESGTLTTAVTGTIATEAGVATTVTITVNGQSYTATVDAANGTWTANVATSDLVADTTVAVSVTSTDAAGNSTTTTSAHNYSVDIEAPELTVSVDLITADNVVNAAEAGTSIAVTGKVTGEFNEGDVVTLTVNGAEHTGTVGANGVWSIAVAGSELAGAGSLTVSVTTADAAGNTTTADATHTYSVDTVASATISINDVTNDNIVNGTESAGTVTITGTVGGDAKVGDTVTVQIGDHSVTTQVVEGNTWSVDVAGSILAGNALISAAVAASDTAGNRTTADATHVYSVDTVATATISINDVTNDNIVNATESAGTVTITGTVGGDAKVGDTVTIQIGDHTVTTQVAEGNMWSVDVAGSVLEGNTSISASVAASDAAGNTTTVDATHAYSVDTVATATISINDVTSDNTVNLSESNGTVAISGSVGGDAKVGDTVTVQIGEHTVTTQVAEGSTWSVGVAGSVLAGNASISASVAASDAAGNTTTADATHIYSVDVVAAATISINDVTSDNIVNATESAGTVTITGTVGGDAKVGDTVTVQIGEHTVTTQVAEGNTWSVDVAGSILEGNASISASVAASDMAGNTTTADATQAYSVDTVAPDLTVSVNSITSDNVINVAESGAETIAVTGTLATEAGAATTVTITVNGQDYVATVDTVNGTWTANVATTDLLTDSAVAVSATSTDAAGNSTTTTTTHGYSVDTVAPELTVSVDPVTSDNVVNAVESAAATIAVTGTVGAEAGATTTVTITVNGQDYVATVDTVNGTWTANVATTDLLTDSTVAVSATSTDAAGNSTTTTTTHGYGVDTVAPEVSITVDSVTDDNVVNAVEAGTSIDVTGKVTGEFNAGDTVTLTVNGVEHTGTVGADGVWSIEVAGSDVAASGSLTVSVTTSDAAGNTTTADATHTYSVDVVAAATISINDVTNDNIVNATESTETVAITGTVGGDAKVGDTVTVQIGDHTVTTQVAEGNTWSVDVAGSILAGNASISASVAASDAAGNTTTADATQAYSLDTVAEATISINDVTSDNIVNATESAGTVTIAGTVGGDAKVGDTVTVQIGEYIVTTTVVEGNTWSVDVAGSVLAGNASISASVAASDAAGNTTTADATHTYSVDTVASASITINDVTNDNIVNATESAGTVIITGTVGGDAKVGDTVTVQIGEHTVTTQVVEGNTWSVDVAGSILAGNASISASVVASDAAGNTTTADATHAYSVDTVAAATIDINDVTSDNIVNATESAGTVAITGSVGGDAKVGDTVTVQIGDHTVTTQVVEGNAWSVDVAGSILAGNALISASVAVSDAAGNTTTADATHTYSVDTAAEASITINDVTGDNTVNFSESNSTVVITGSVGGDAKIGDTVTVQIGDHSVTTTVVEGNTWSVDVAGSILVGNASISASVAASDAAGNTTTADATHTYSVDTVASASITINDVTNDNIVNATESAGTVSITGSVGGDAKVGDTVTLQVGEHTVTTQVAEGNTWSLDVAGSILAGNASISASVAASDTAGNSTTATRTHNYSVDIVAPDLTVAVDAITSDNVINLNESGAPTTVVTGTIATEAGAATTVTIMVNGHDYIAAVDAEHGTWTANVATTDLVADRAIAVNATATDAAGNEATTTATHGYGVDTVAPELTVSVDSITGDNVINAAEAGASIAVTGKVSGEFNEGDVVTLTVNGAEHTGAVDADGVWSIAVAGSELAASGSLTVSVTTADTAGNSTTTTATHGYSVDTVAPELTVAVDSITSDNVINLTESGVSTMAVSGTIETEVGATTTVTITVNGQGYVATVDTENGTWTASVATSDLVADTTVAVNATSIDAAGNETAVLATHTYGVDTIAPEVSIMIDSITDDNVVNATEAGTSIAVTGKVTGEFNEGDTVTLIVNGAEHTGAVNADGVWSIAVSGSELAEAGSLTVSVTTADTAGNTTTADSTHAYSVDTVAAATISINDVTSDNIVNATESAGTVTITGTVGGDAKVGDTVTVRIGEHTVTTTVAEGNTWSVDVAGSVLAGSASISASVVASDAAGNTTTADATHTYSVDTAAEASITINDVTSDNTVNFSESNSTVAITGSVGGDAKIGDIVTVQIGEHSVTTQVVEGNTWSVDVAGSILAGNASISASVAASDAAGNTTTADATHTYNVDTAAEATISINDVTNDNIVNATESVGTVSITGSVGGDAKVGDTVTVQIGEHTVTTQVAEGNTWSVEVAGSILAGNASISASVAASDAAGNTATANATHTYSVDTVAEATISINDVTSDNTVNLSESNGTVAISGSVGGDAKVGDTVTVTVGDHSVTTTVGEGNTWSVDVAGSILVGNASISASVAASDAAGNTTTADAMHAYSVDTVAAATISINDVTSDNVVNATESAGTVTITGTVGGDAKIGDTVTVQIGEHTVTTQVVEGNTWSVDVAGSLLADHVAVSASVAASDAVGNTTTSDATHTYSVDTVAEATISIDDVTSDNVVNATESGDTVVITGTVGGDAKVGDTVTVTIGDHTVTTQIVEGNAWSVDVAGSILAGNASISASVVASDAAGNTTTADATHAYSVDTVASATISIDDVTSDNVVNATESAGIVSITGSVGGDAKLGDTVTVQIGEHTVTTQVAEGNTWSVDVAGSILAGNASISASVAASDAAGNTTTADATHAYSVDTVASATISIDDVTSDNVVNATESSSTVAITGSVGGDAKVGDTVTVQIGDHSVTTQVAEGNTWSVDVAGSILAGNASISASVTASDAAGNTTTADATHTYSVDTVAEASITINEVTNDNIVNATESAGTVTITGTVGGDAKVGDTVTVQIGDHSVTTQVVEGNTWSVDVAGSILAGNASISASVAASDAAGNNTTADATHTYSVDTAAEASITINDVTGDNTVNFSESNSTVAITGSVGGDAKVGDTVTVQIGDHSVTTQVVEGNTWSVGVAGSILAGNASISASVAASDAAGNNTTADATHTYSVDTAAEASITINDVTGDNTVNFSESNSTVAITGSVGGDAKVGDTVTVQIGEHSVTTQVVEGNTWSVEVAGSILAGNASISASVVASDAAGNETTADATHVYSVDTVASASITINEVTNDNIVNATESAGTVTITGTVGGDVKVGDTVTVQIGEHSVTTQVVEGNTWSVDVAGSVLEGNTSISASVAASDAVGNETTADATHAYSVDVVAAATITINDVTSDNVINFSESNGTVSITGSVGGDAKVGDTVTVTLGEHTMTTVVVEGNTWSVDVAGSILAGNASISASVAASDAAGNTTTADATHTYSVDVVAEATISINDVTSDNIVNATESAGTVSITGSVGGDAKVGDTVTVQIGEHTVTTQVVEGNTWSVDVAGSILAGNASISASVVASDAAGNNTTADATHTYSVDTAAEASITINDVTNDNIVNATESAGTVTITGSVSGDAKVGDTVTVTVGDHSVTTTVVEGNAWSVDVAGSILAGNASISASVVASDAAGNTTTVDATHTYSVDTAAEATISINDVTNDNIVNATESVGAVSITGSVGGDAKVGDTVTVQIGEHTVTTQVAEGKTWSVDVAGSILAGNASISASVAASDAAGNTTTADATHAYSVDMVAEATISINDVTNDNIVNATESTGTVSITGSVGGDAKVGDTVTIQIGDHTVTTQVAEGNTWSVDVAGSILAGNASISASVAASDAAGNTTTADATHAYSVDVVAAATISINDVTSDNIVNATESAGTVAITGSVGGDAKVGDTVTVQIGDHTVTTQVAEGNTWSVDVAGSILAGNASISVSVAASDAAGNTTTADATHAYSVDTVASASISIDDVTNDNIVNFSESNDTVEISGTVGGDAKVGDTVTVTIGDHTVTTQVAEGNTWSVDVAGSILAGNASISASVTASDAAGNTTTADATRAYSVDTVAEATISINDVTNDNTVNATESAGTVVITGSVGGDAKVGDTVTVTIGDHIVTTQVAEDNTWSVGVAGSILAGNASISASVAASDAAGNTATANATHTYSVDTVAEATIAINGVTNDNIVNATESAGTVAITGTVGGDAKVGDAVTVTVGDHSVTTTVIEGNTWSVDVAGSILAGNVSISASVAASDAAGNTTTADAAHAYSVDTVAEATISINDVTSDNTVNLSESNGTIAISGSVGGDAKVGDTVTVTIGDHIVTTQVAEGNTWSVDVAGSVLAGNASISASVAASDAAGNTTTADATHAYSVDTVAEATIAINGVTSDNIVNATESAGTVTITGTVGGDAKIGDTVTVQIGDHSVTTQVAEGNAWSVDVAGSILAGNASISASVAASDAAGNTTTANATHRYSVDTVATATISINDVTGDNIVNATESAGTVSITGSVGGDAKVGDTVTVQIGDHTVTTQVAEGNAWSVDVAGSILAGNASISASVAASDAAGNTTTADATHTYSVDTVAEASITIDNVTNDNTVNATESAGTVAISGTVGGDAKVGDTVTIQVGDHSVTTTVVEGNTWSVNVAGSILAGNASISASVAASDAAGNTTTANATHTYSVDTVASATISIDDVTSDNTVNFSESNGTVAISGAVGGDAKVGDTVTVQIGEHTVTTQVLEGNTWSVSVAGSVLAGNASISASVAASDAAGNTTTANAMHAYSVDTVATATISINDVTSDNIVNATESAGTVSITGSVGGDAKVGDTVTVQIGDHSVTTQVAEGNTWSVDVAGSILAGNASISASVAASDTAGNTTIAGATHDYTVNLAPVAQGGEAQGVEDTPLVLGWDNFHVAGSSAELGVLITGLPGAGVLEYSSNPGAADAVWVRVDLADGGFAVSRAELEAGQLRFVPQANESGWNGLDGSGVGNGQADYAQISFKPVDGDYVGEAAVLKVDIVAVVDAPVVTLSLGDVTPGGGADAGAGTQFTFAGITLTVLNDGSVSASGLPGQVFAPPFGKETSGNVNYGDQSPATDIIAVIGNFDKVVLGRDGREWDSLRSISGQGDYVFFNKSSGEYSVTNMTVNVNNGIPNIAATVTDHASGLSVRLNNIRGILFGDGDSVGGKNSAPIAGLETHAIEGSYVDVEVNVTAMLTDRDGSESLSGITLSGIPAGVTLVGATLLSNGNWFVSNASSLLTLDGHLVMRVPNGTEPFSITASATSSELGLVGSESTSTSNTSVDVGDLAVNIAPVASGGEVTGSEDTAHLLSWSDFGVTDVDTLESELAIVITGLPANGVLQFNADPTAAATFWTSIGLVDGQYQISRADIEAGKLRFMPGDNESGSDAYGVGGVGNQQSDYAHILFRPTDGVSMGAEATLRVDITATADAPVLNLSLGETESVVTAPILTAMLDSGAGFTVTAGVLTAIGGALLHSIAAGSSANGPYPNTPVVFYLTGGITATQDGALIKGVPAGGLDDVIYLSKGAQQYLITEGPGNSWNTILDLETGYSVKYHHILDIVFSDGTSKAGLLTVDSLAEGYETRALDLSAQLVDVDGSESLSAITLTGVPADVHLSAGTLQADGSWVIELSQLHGLSMELPFGTPEFTLVASVTAAESVGGSTATTVAELIVQAGSSATEPGEGATPPGPDDPGAGLPEPEYVYSEASLLVNGDFSQFANAQGGGWQGNNDAGYTAWTHTGPFLDLKWMMAGRPYVGAWNNDARDITLSQDVSGVSAGSRLELDIGWNNPNNGILNDPWNSPKDTGNAMHLEISFGGVVYAVISTPSAGEQVGNSWFASVTAMNGASVNIDKIETWSYDYSTNNGNNGLRPGSLDGFHALQITLPEDVAASGSLQLRWDPQSEGSQYTDDLMVANLKLFSAAIVGTDGNDVLVGTDGNDILIGGHGSDVLFGGAGDDVFKWELGDEGATAGSDVVKDFGLDANGVNGNDTLDLSDLLVTGDHAAGDLSQYLHIGLSQEAGVTSTVIRVATHGGLTADGGGFNHQIVLENVDLMGAYHDQSQLIQSLINEGKLKIDQ